MNLRLPNSERPYIPELELTGYLLSESHPIGRSKARVFRHMGYDEQITGDPQ